MENDIVTHVILVAGIVKKGERYLFAKRKSSDPQEGGTWNYLGGKVDCIDERLYVLNNTLKKELKEEVGVEIEEGIQLIHNWSFIRVSGHHVVGLMFLCNYRSGIAKPLEGQEEVGWFTLEEARKLNSKQYFKDCIDAIEKYLEFREISI